jgi:hypothetical protein
MDTKKFLNHFKAAIVIVCCGIELSACAHNLFRTDVERFVERRALCDHFRGEISGEPDKFPERVREVNLALDKYCKGIDKELIALKAHHKDDAKITAKLNAYELVGGDAGD